MPDICHLKRIIDRNPMTTPDEVRALVAIMRDPTSTPDQVRAARDRLIVGNLRLVVRVARIYQGRGVSIDDLISEGQFGLLRCIKTYDPDQGKFSTYATWYISASIRLAVTKSGHIRVPTGTYDMVGKYKRAARKLAAQLNREPTQAEVFDTMAIPDCTRALIASALSVRLTSTDVLWHERAAKNTDAVELADELAVEWAKLRRMHPRKLDILRREHGEGHTHAEVARDYGITRERVRQIAHMALAEAKAILSGGSAARVRAEFEAKKHRHRHKAAS